MTTTEIITNSLSAGLLKIETEAKSIRFSDGEPAMRDAKGIDRDRLDLLAAVGAYHQIRVQLDHAHERYSQRMHEIFMDDIADAIEEATVRIDINRLLEQPCEVATACA